MEPEGSIPNSQELSNCFHILSQTNSVHISPSRLSKIHPNIIHPPTFWFSYRPLSFCLFLQQCICVSLLPHLCYLSHPSHPPRLDYFNCIWRKVQIRKLLVMQFSPLSCHLIPLRPNILLSTLFSNTLSLRSSLKFRDQGSHPYETTGKIILLHIQIFTFFDREQKILD
jgi:hypothetical protein